jgi:hypothetical protein
MGKEAKNELMGNVYREFSRQKYNKYKAQFPKLRESEIVSKIIKEWDSLDSAAKESLQKIYEKKNYLTSEDISSSEALVKADLASKEATWQNGVSITFILTVIHFVLQMIRTKGQAIHPLDFTSFIIHLIVMGGTITIKIYSCWHRKKEKQCND